MRSSERTKSLLAESVVAWTKATIADFAGPSFQEGSGSAMEAKRLEVLASGAEVAELIDRRARRRERKRLEWRGDHLVQVALQADPDGDVRHEVLARMFRNERS